MVRREAGIAPQVDFGLLERLGAGRLEGSMPSPRLVFWKINLNSRPRGRILGRIQEKNNDVFSWTFVVGDSRHIDLYSGDDGLEGNDGPRRGFQAQR